jgi:hypothetical protein
VPPDSSEELALYMLEMYLPREMWELPNIYLAGIRQNLSIGPEETFVVQAIVELWMTHYYYY